MELGQWCREHGIEIQATAPYSPLQNGVAECMNRTLVELARAMLLGQKLPEFLWEPAVAHTTYLRNHSFTHTVPTTPYEQINKKKPDVAHLKEFGAPVWILLQGQKLPRKLLRKSHRKMFIGFDNGAKAVRYYNPDSHKVLTSRNFRFLTLDDKGSCDDEIVVTPNISHEGELEGGTQATRDVTHGGLSTERVPDNLCDSTILRDDHDSLKRKREELNNEPRKTCGKKVDYKKLNNPFSDSEEEALTTEFIHMDDETYIAAASDGPSSLKEAWNSKEWPKWEQAIKAELNQLHDMGTWALVDKPSDALPITNKWVFQKKINKEGQIIKYKARLVMKGCAQRPGHDYLETHSPVVRLETIRVILAMVPAKKLVVQQMDIKGAYLNGILKEKVYMHQPEGFEDETKKICLLIKTLYGLKQSGREWNIQFDARVRKHGFLRLRSDPCVYV